jgi:hypothetical protein
MNKELRKFGFSLGLGLNIMGGIIFYRHKEHFIWFSSIGSIALIMAISYPVILSPVKKILEKVIFIIGWLTSVISLLIAFYLIFTPIALLLKVFGKDMLNERINKAASSYWIKRKEENLSLEKRYERMG